MKLSANQWEFARAFFLPKNRDRVFMGGEREREREREERKGGKSALEERIWALCHCDCTARKTETYPVFDGPVTLGF
jgi:hypothetical protein